jgi:catechol 2,3-dioxygenase-like lactoylglutathione lyase family enzyme
VEAAAWEGLADTGDKALAVKNFDHVTVCVSDLEAAKRFFGLLGLKEDKSVVISGERFAAYMGLDEIEADHVTLMLPGASPRFEVQLLHYRRPEAARDPNMARLDKLGFNHICFAVDDIDALVEDLRSNGVEVRGELRGFHDRRLFFLTGPDGITVELAQWS